MNDTCGPTSGTPLAQYDRDERCWKTSEATSLWALKMSSLTLPPWGCLRDGELYELPTRERPTIEPGYSLLLSTPDTMPEAPNSGSNRRSHPSGLLNQVVSAVLPTPRATAAMGDPMDTTLSMRERRGYSKFRLEETVATLPTPTAQAAKHMTMDDRGEGTHDDHNLWSVAGQMLPTPQALTATNDLDFQVSGDGRDKPNKLGWAISLLPTPAVNDMGAGKDPQAWDEWAARQKAADGRPAPHGKSLEQEALRVGATTPPPSSDGNTSPDDQLQPPLFSEQDEIA